MLDEKILQDFRCTVNHGDWTLFKYVNVDDKNKWNIICSAMDWIEVSVEYMNCHPLTKLWPRQSMEFFSYIACVYVMVEAVEQLHRVIFSTDKQIFGKDRTCFPENPFGQCDRVYFETIRSCFGAHPVNLKDPQDPNNKDIKRYASWSVGSLTYDADFSVILYSNKHEKGNIILNVWFEEIDNFAQKYYFYLNELREKIVKDYHEFCARMRKQVFDCTGDPITRLRILQSECVRRLNNEYYSRSIKELLLVFETPITCKSNQKMVTAYSNSLLSTIDEIQANLQNMTLVDLKIDAMPKPSEYPLQSGWSYWVEKLDEARQGIGYHESYWLKEIEELFQGQFVFEYSDYEELYVLVSAAIFRMVQEKKIVKNLE